MTKPFFIVITSILLFGCHSGNFEKADPNLKVGQVDTVAIYWKPIHYDTIKASIKEHITFPGDDTLTYLPSDRDLTLKFEFSGKMKEYMKHGKMIVRPFDSTVLAQRINNSSFRLKASKSRGDRAVITYYELTFNKPYFFSYIFDGTTRSAKPGDTILLFLRSRTTKPSEPAD